MEIIENVWHSIRGVKPFLFTASLGEKQFVIVISLSVALNVSNFVTPQIQQRDLEHISVFHKEIVSLHTLSDTLGEKPSVF